MFSIVADEEDFLIVSKSPNISFHRDDNSCGLLGAVREHSGYSELYPVHRLDKITSGLLVLAKNRQTNQNLSQQFQNRQTEKYYLAISARKPQKKQGLIQGDMEKSRRGSWKLLRSLKNPAVTQFFSQGLGNGLRLFLVKPYTGKTHQIRVALKSLGAPVLGDPLYGDSDAEPADRGYLHSLVLGFHLHQKKFRYVSLPDTGHHFTDGCNTGILQNYARPWELNWPLINEKKRTETKPSVRHSTQGKCVEEKN